jgi:hypothetical protein
LSFIRALRPSFPPRTPRGPPESYRPGDPRATVADSERARPHRRPAAFIDPSIDPDRHRPGHLSILISIDRSSIDSDHHRPGSPSTGISTDPDLHRRKSRLTRITIHPDRHRPESPIDPRL